MLLCAPLALAGCGGEAPRVVSAPPKPVAAPRKPPVTAKAAAAVPQPEVMHLPGLGGVIGARAGALLQEFGTPRIDLTEGDVRKLQFAGTQCVLDIYLYPPGAGGEPVATHVDARRASDGKDVDRGQCVAALRKG